MAPNALWARQERRVDEAWEQAAQYLVALEPRVERRHLIEDRLARSLRLRNTDNGPVRRLDQEQRARHVGGRRHLHTHQHQGRSDGDGRKEMLPAAEYDAGGHHEILARHAGEGRRSRSCCGRLLGHRLVSRRLITQHCLNGRCPASAAQDAAKSQILVVEDHAGHAETLQRRKLHARAEIGVARHARQTDEEDGVARRAKHAALVARGCQIERQCRQADDDAIE